MTTTTTTTTSEPVSFESFFLDITFNEKVFNINLINSESYGNDGNDFSGCEKYLCLSSYRFVDH